MTRRASRELRKASSLIFRLLGKKGGITSLIATLMIGVSLGILYEETVGIGTWHSYRTNTENMSICFTPPSGCQDLIAQQISDAKKSIYVQAYGLTAQPIIYQLKQAKTRGVEVRVLLDGGSLSNNKGIFDELKKAGIGVAFDKMPGIAHNKVMIIDKSKVITGSFNFTKAANTRNAENVVLIEDKEVAAKYLKNWRSRAEAAAEKSKNTKPKRKKNKY